MDTSAGCTNLTNGRALRSLLLIGSIVVMLSGCEGRGCFGLCDERDDLDSDNETTTGLDLSCYNSGTITARADNIAYADDASGEQLLRFYDSNLASSINPRPVLIWVTGETWQVGTTIGNAPTLALNIARRLGIHFVAVSFRQSDTNDAEWPAQLIDVKTAIRFLQDQNTAMNFAIDLDQIYLGGDQAGATLAALAAFTPTVDEFQPSLFPNETDTPDLLITLGGMYNFNSVLANNESPVASCLGIEPNITEVAIRQLFNCAVPEEGADPLLNCDANDLQLASPVEHVGPSVPETLFYHGALDCAAPEAQSVELDAAFSVSGEDSFLRTRAIFTSLSDDTDAFESLEAQDILEDLIGFNDFDCDDDT